MDRNQDVARLRLIQLTSSRRLGDGYNPVRVSGLLRRRGAKYYDEYSDETPSSYSGGLSEDLGAGGIGATDEM